jgi:hypothetical protein
MFVCCQPVCHEDEALAAAANLLLTCTALPPASCCAQSDKIRGVAVMSPEVREMQKTPVNDDICERLTHVGRLLDNAPACIACRVSST